MHTQATFQKLESGMCKIEKIHNLKLENIAWVFES